MTYYNARISSQHDGGFASYIILGEKPFSMALMKAIREKREAGKMGGGKIFIPIFAIREMCTRSRLTLGEKIKYIQPGAVQFVQI